MKKNVIPRDGFPPLAFTGELLASGTDRHHDSTRWTIIDLYLTEGGRYVACESWHSRWVGERDTRRAASFSCPREAIEWLGGKTGRLGLAAQAAVEEAASCDEAFAAAWIEKVP